MLGIWLLGGGWVVGELALLVPVSDSASRCYLVARMLTEKLVVNDSASVSDEGMACEVQLGHLNELILGMPSVLRSLRTVGIAGGQHAA